jgi:uncharacterized membrane protein
VIAFLLLLRACGSGDPGAALPGDATSAKPFSGIAVDETLHFTGTEPFWAGEVSRNRVTYTTPDDPKGASVSVERFAGRNGVSFSGSLRGQDFVMAISPGRCSDGMSDRIYPFHVVLRALGETREGCAWSDAHPFSPAEGG